MSESIWTVGRLISKLRKFPSNMPIVGIYDWKVVEDAVKKHRWMETVTVQDVVGLRTDKSRKQNAVAIKTTKVLDLG
jgi:hypothetical protein